MKLNRTRNTVTSIVAAILLLAASCSSVPAVATNTSGAATSAAATAIATSEAKDVESEGAASEAESANADSSEETIGSGSAAATSDIVLDDTTITWFDSFCTALAPVFKVGAQAPPSGSDLAAAKVTGTALSAVGNQLTEDIAALSDLDAPTFTDGEELATTAITGLTDASQALIKVGGELEAGDVSGVDAFSTALSSNPLSNLGTLSQSPEFQIVPEQVPACAAIG